MNFEPLELLNQNGEALNEVKLRNAAGIQTLKLRNGEAKKLIDVASHSTLGLKG